MRIVYSLLIWLAAPSLFAFSNVTNSIVNRVNYIEQHRELYTSKTVELNEFDLYVMQSDNTQYSVISLNIPDLYLNGFPHDVTYTYYFDQSDLIFISILTLTYDADFKNIMRYNMEHFYISQGAILLATEQTAKDEDYLSQPPKLNSQLSRDPSGADKILKKAYSAWNSFKP